MRQRVSNLTLKYDNLQLSQNKLLTIFFPLQSSKMSIDCELFVNIYRMTMVIESGAISRENLERGVGGKSLGETFRSHPRITNKTTLSAILVGVRKRDNMRISSMLNTFQVQQEDK